LEEATYERLGGDEIMVADVRVVVASHPPSSASGNGIRLRNRVGQQAALGRITGRFF
jgi:DNA-binding NtrC family response regulator